MPTSDDTRWNLWVVLSLSSVWGLTFVYEATPLNETKWCLWRALTDLNCAGCGLTRSFCAMSSGEPWGAAKHHPAGPLLYVGMIVAWFQTGLRWRRREASALRLPSRLLQVYWLSVIVVFAAHMVRTLSNWSDLTY